ncbi:MAG TPA: cytochrome c oxidase subunit I, partial [Candidatus Methylomirabilis sp.]|nr:cytochrome c oxidase subunit I [Candidatus Methylomirabilis sp.]
GKQPERNPWHANTLEWAAPSPPPHGNWGETLPAVFGGPYEYSVPGMAEDYLPQNQPRQPSSTSAPYPGPVHGKVMA